MRAAVAMRQSAAECDRSTSSSRTRSAAAIPMKSRALIAAGADVRYQREHGYHALVDAVQGRDVPRDPRAARRCSRCSSLNGADLNGVTAYKESGLRVLSHIGRFDAVRLLLEAGADKGQLGWTPLIEAVALGSLADVEREIAAGAPLEAIDWWERTALLMALVAGDRPKAQLLRRARRERRCARARR